MTQEEITTGNILIADFMGFYGNPTTKEPITSIAKDSKYHSSWDWLMPVVKKVQNLPISFRVKNISPLVTWEHRLKEAMWQGGERLYIEVIEFIKWYNQQSK